MWEVPVKGGARRAEDIRASIYPAVTGVLKRSTKRLLAWFCLHESIRIFKPQPRHDLRLAQLHHLRVFVEFVVPALGMQSAVDD